jgi:hypothetical protein
MGLMEIGDIPTYGKSQKITLANVGLAISSSMRCKSLDATFFFNYLLMVTSMPFLSKGIPCKFMCFKVKLTNRTSMIARKMVPFTPSHKPRSKVSRE